MNTYWFVVANINTGQDYKKVFKFDKLMLFNEGHLSIKDCGYQITARSIRKELGQQQIIIYAKFYCFRI